MIAADLVELSAVEALQAFAAGEASPPDLVEACLDRIAAVEPSVNAILTLCADRARAGAEAAAERWANGTNRPLEGVPFGVKDVIATAGVRTTGGSLIYADLVPSGNATVVEKLEQDGAVLLAKTQTFEFAFGDNSHYGPTRNPWDLERTPGGSSSGSGAALAARELPIALGTDTGGSTRVPATLCGIVGFKPTYGRLSRHGVMTQSWTLDHVGLMARTVEDVALLTAVTAGHDPQDPTSIDVPVDDYAGAAARDLSGVRIALPTNWFFDVCDPEMAAATRQVAAELGDAGAEIVEVEIPHAHLVTAITYTIMFGEFASLHEVTFDRLEEYSAGLTRQLLATSQFVSAKDYLRALRSRHLLQRDFEAVFECADALLTPGTVAAAPGEDMAFTVGGERLEWGDVVGNMTMVMNLCGVPALSFPSGFTAAGLPLGVQVAARPFDDATCLRIGAAYQRLTDHHRRAPALGAEAVPR
jgi:aspartyl-tRNA(Asn)/glutamyl-tRNA(Gln) amidotransferase subunit A